MYLVYVLDDILEGKLTKSSIDRIDRLPTGLRAYYERHWREMKKADPGRFERIYEPVLCQLAVVREPVTLQQLQEWTKLPAARIREVIREWRQFLNEHDDDGGDSRYRLYHASFQDFLREEVGLVRFHNNIVQTSLGKIPDISR